MVRRISEFDDVNALPTVLAGVPRGQVCGMARTQRRRAVISPSRVTAGTVTPR